MVMSSDAFAAETCWLKSLACLQSDAKIMASRAKMVVHASWNP